MILRQSISTFLVVLITSFVVFAQSDQFSLNKSPLPPPTGMVNDYANVIDDAMQAQIEKKLRDFKSSTNPTTEIAVVTVDTTGERPIFEYSLAVARGWGIGSKETANPSALLLIAISDRKAYVQISKDLEGDLPDGITTSLQRQYLVPAFKQAQYGKGINDLMDAYIQRINANRTGQPVATPTGSKESRGMPFGCYVLICLIVLGILLIIIFFRGGGSGGGGGSGQNRDRWRSGGFGGNTSTSTSPIIFWGGGGGSSSSDWGSSSSGGGDSWGGFGGGGDFGGGGGGSDW